MSAYFVTHPMMDKTAVVYAPSTEKARTTFLDWLERNGLMSRRQRQALRRDMVAKRLEDPGVPADVELHYGYEGAPPPSYRIPQTTEEERRLAAGEPPEEVYYPKLTEEEERLASGEIPEEVYYPEEPKSKRIPIQEVMLRGFG